MKVRLMKEAEQSTILGFESIDSDFGSSLKSEALELWLKEPLAQLEIDRKEVRRREQEVLNHLTQSCLQIEKNKKQLFLLCCNVLCCPSLGLTSARKLSAPKIEAFKNKSAIRLIRMSLPGLS